jgi:hypothetical protein
MLPNPKPIPKVKREVPQKGKTIWPTVMKSEEAKEGSYRSQEISDYCRVSRRHIII